MPPIEELTVLIPIDISADEVPTLGILDLLGPIDVVLLGYFPVPIQAEPALIKDEYEVEANQRLVDIAEGRPDLTEVLVFTHDRGATVDRVADEYGCDAVLTTGDVERIDRILVPIRGDVNLERIVSVVAGLLAASGATATLFHSVDEDTDPSQGEFLLRGAVDRFVDFGIDESRIDRRLSSGGDPRTEIVDLAREYDVVVLGETEPSLRERVMGDVLSRIVDEIDAPALIVRDVG
ncbi:universal stress protein [Salinigranum sp. GCM10025319]|uniref:universal stress protein n=1 Tax=Salinigranum sp. GCM10025319 TaxID=3252687 RepID=UPI00361D2EE2